MRNVKTRFNAGFCMDVIDIVIGYCDDRCVVGSTPALVNALSSYILWNYFGVPDAVIASELKCTCAKVHYYVNYVDKQIVKKDGVFSEAITSILDEINKDIPAVNKEKMISFARESIKNLNEIRNDPNYISLLEKYKLLGINPLAITRYMETPDKLGFVSQLIEHRKALTDDEFALLQRIIDYVMEYERMSFDDYDWADAYDEILRCIQDEDSEYIGNEIKTAEEEFLQGLTSIEELIACLISHHIDEYKEESFLIEKSLPDGGVIRIYEALLKKLE